MTWSVEVRRAPDPRRLSAELREGLARRPAEIPPKWFYDEKGSQLFDQITELPEYYPTQTETAILAEHACELPRVGTLIELGAGYSRKTKLLLQALQPALFVPLDVSEEPIRDAATRIDRDFPTIRIRGIIADFEDELAPLPGSDGDRLIAFLGSTIGNLTPGPRSEFLQRLHRATAPGDLFLLGADLVKDARRLVKAYDDSAGVTAAFNKNVLNVLARELDIEPGILDPDDFDHVAIYNAEHERIEMRLMARRDLVVPLLGLEWRIHRGEQILTETSAKFRIEGLRAELAAAGFQVETTWTDPAEDFSVTVARRV